MNPKLNRWTGQPHTHARERARKRRQMRRLIIRDLAIVERAIAEVSHVFSFENNSPAGIAIAEALAELRHHHQEES